MSRKLTTTIARHILVIMWFSFFLGNLAVVFYLYLDEWIEADFFWSSLQQINALYVTYLALIITFYFAGPDRKYVPRRHAGAPFVVAISASLIWNLTISIFFFRLLIPHGTIDDSIKQIALVGPLLSWLVVPAIAYYFARPSNHGDQS